MPHNLFLPAAGVNRGFLEGAVGAATGDMPLPVHTGGGVCPGYRGPGTGAVPDSGGTGGAISAHKRSGEFVPVLVN